MQFTRDLVALTKSLILHFFGIDQVDREHQIATPGSRFVVQKRFGFPPAERAVEEIRSQDWDEELGSLNGLVQLLPPEIARLDVVDILKDVKWLAGPRAHIQFKGSAKRAYATVEKVVVEARIA